MGSLRLAVLGGGFLAASIAACGLETGGIDLAADGGGDLDVSMMDASMDQQMLPDAPMDIMTPDLGTGETETGVPCTCTPALPQGWAFVTYEGNMRDACSMGYGAPLDTNENVTAKTSTCTCKCGNVATQPTCGGGDVNFTYGFGTANNSCGKITGTVSCSPGCKSTGNVATGGNGGDYRWHSMNAVITPQGGTCDAPTITTDIPQSTSDQGRICALQSSPGSCMTGACVPTPAKGWGVCISKPGIEPMCPMGFPNTHYVGDVDDTRSCGPNQCACTISGTCTTTASTYWGSNNCGINNWQSNPLTANGTCGDTTYNGSNGAIQSCKYTSTPANIACGFSGTYTPQGNLGIKNAITVCCL